VRILVINPGSTSTKWGLYSKEEGFLFEENISHRPEDLAVYPFLEDQVPYRLSLITDHLDELLGEEWNLSAVVGRGGLMKPVQGGTYLINDRMLYDLEVGVQGQHASNLGASLAYMIAEEEIPAFVVDPVAVDEFEPLARYSGWPGIERRSLSHALNMKAVGREFAKDMGTSYEELNLVMVHLGSGISVAAHKQGQMVDVNNANEEGPFSLERSGTLPLVPLLDLAYSGEYSREGLIKALTGKAGLYGYLGTKSLIEIEKRIAEGSKKDREVLEALAYQVAKEIGAMSTVLKGSVDGIILTGGMAYSELLCSLIKERTEFIATVSIYPGEKEMLAMALGALRVLEGKEEALQYEP